MLFFTHYFYIVLILLFFLNQIKAITHIITDNTEPAGDAIPIGKRVSVYIFYNRYENGILTQTIDNKLCINDINDIP